jgi:predicted nucleic acid-binding protein
VVLADTNILSTFAKIDQLPILLKLFTDDKVGVVPSVYAEFQAGVERGYTKLQAVIELVLYGQIELVALYSHEILQKDRMPAAFDAGERETLVVAKGRHFVILTNEVQAKNWCKREQVDYMDLPGILRALWTTGLAQRAEVRSLVDLIEARDRIKFKGKEQIFQT